MTLWDIAKKIFAYGEKNKKSYKINDVRFKLGESNESLSNNDTLDSYRISRFSTNLFFAD